MKVKLRLILIIFSISIGSAYTQNIHDSLELGFKQELDPGKKAEYASQLVYEAYATKGDLQASEYYFNYAVLNYNKQKIEKNSFATALRNKGIVLYYSNQIDTALNYFNRSYIHAKTIGDHYSECVGLNNIASCYYGKGETQKALEYYLIGSEKEKKYGYKPGEHISLNNIGYIYGSLKMYEKARSFFRRAIDGAKFKKKLNTLIYSYDGLSNTFPSNSDSSNYYKFKSYNLALKFKDLISVMHSCNDISNYYLFKKDYKNAVTFAEQGLRISDSLKNDAIKSYFYNVFMNVHQELDNAKLALQFADSTKKHIQKDFSPFTTLQLYRSLSLVYNKFNINDSAYKYLNLAHSMSDTLYKNSLANTITEMQTKYDFTQKEKEIEILNETNRRNKIAIYCSIIVAIIIGLLTFNIFKISRKRQKLNIQLNIINEEVQNKNRIIEDKQKETLDSIHYAKRIQNTILAHTDFLNSNIPNNFILFKPKDIVSGDFYWATKKDHLFFLAICDSTGHGVPGAFMSLLNIGFLSEAINEKGIEEPNKVFDFVRERLINSISKEGQKDGFDGILLCIDSKKKRLTYAAANNEPILIANGEIKELSKDKMPVGIGINKTPFSLFDIEMNESDTLYLYTDGYADQFGGPKGKKFLYKKLNQLLSDNSKLPLPQQKEKLEYVFSDWKGNLEQVDDVLVIGIKI